MNLPPEDQPPFDDGFSMEDVENMGIFHVPDSAHGCFVTIASIAGQLAVSTMHNPQPTKQDEALITELLILAKVVEQVSGARYRIESLPPDSDDTAD